MEEKTAEEKTLGSNFKANLDFCKLYTLQYLKLKEGRFKTQFFGVKYTGNSLAKRD